MGSNGFRRIKPVLGVILLTIFLICTMVIPPGVTAYETTVVPANSNHSGGFSDLSEGDVINWDWETVDGEEIHFRIGDAQGNVEVKKVSVSSSEGSFRVPHDGDWAVRWDNPNDWGVEVKHSVTVESVEDDYTSFFTSWYGIAAIMVIAGGILLIYVYEKKKKEVEELKESQQPQQQTQQQPSAPPSQSQQQQPQQAQQQPQQAPPPPVQGSSTQQTQRQDGKPCPECDTPMRYVQQYDRWYCDNCGKYQ